jgi:hypothetical protein
MTRYNCQYARQGKPGTKPTDQSERQLENAKVQKLGLNSEAGNTSRRRSMVGVNKCQMSKIGG